ncbi:unnamed protein product, partial [Symbiodinium sp. CCMP2592]
ATVLKIQASQLEALGEVPRKASVDPPTSWHAAQAPPSSMIWAPCDEPEEPQPLRLLRHRSDEHTSQAECLVSDPTRRCFAFHWPGFLGRDTAQSYFDELQAHAPWDQLRSRKGHVMRSTCWFARGGCNCDYTYGDARVSLTRRSSSGSFAESME